MHTMPLLQAPGFGSPIVGLVWVGTTVTVEQRLHGFVVATTPDGQRGYLPAAACEPRALGDDTEPQSTRVIQPIWLYCQPQAGAQYPPTDADDPQRWLVLPTDRLLLLGRDELFVLVQRDDGQIGYVPAQLCASDAPAAGRPGFSLALALGGGVWVLPQLLALRSLTTWLQPLVGGAALPLRLLLLGGVVLALRLGARWSNGGRSFAIGLVSVAALIEGVWYLTGA